LAGQLELADKEFSRLGQDVDGYTAELEEKTRKGELNIELSSASLGEFLTKLSEKHAISSLKESEHSKFAAVIDELHRFGIDTIQSLDGLISQEFCKELKAFPGTTTQVGLLRKAMMYANIDKYFTQAWHRQWSSMTPTTEELLRRRWGRERLDSIRKTFLPVKKPHKQARDTQSPLIPNV